MRIAVSPVIAAPLVDSGGTVGWVKPRGRASHRCPGSRSPLVGGDGLCPPYGLCERSASPSSHRDDQLARGRDHARVPLEQDRRRSVLLEERRTRDPVAGRAPRAFAGSRGNVSVGRLPIIASRILTISTASSGE